MTSSEEVMLPPAARVFRPSGPGPFPTVIMMHGCGGLQPFLFEYGKAFGDAGLAVVIVDSFAHRKISRLSAHLTVCTGLQLRGRERAQDLFEVIDWLTQQKWSSAGQIIAAGWSHGGWAIMDAMSLAGSRADLMARAGNIRGVLLIYPYCGPFSQTAAKGWGELRPKVTAILGQDDAVVGVQAPLRALGRLINDGVSVDTHIYDDATHAFDDDRASDPRSRFRADLRERAISLAVAFA